MFYDYDEFAVDEFRAEQEQDAREALESCLAEAEEAEEGWEDDGQPSEYEEWQDVYGGDVEEYGTFGSYED